MYKRQVPFTLPPRPSTIKRSWRSFMSMQRFQAMRRGSMFSGLQMCIRDSYSDMKEGIVSKEDYVELHAAYGKRLRNAEESIDVYKRQPIDWRRLKMRIRFSLLMEER